MIADLGHPLSGNGRQGRSCPPDGASVATRGGMGRSARVAEYGAIRIDRREDSRQNAPELSGAA
jgi:hypothetical protein